MTDISIGTLYYIVVALGKFKYTISKHVHKLEPYRHVVCRNECDHCFVQTDQLERISHVRFLDYNCHTALCYKCNRKYGRFLNIWIDRIFWNYIPISCIGINKYYYVNIKRSVGRIEKWQISPRSYIILKYSELFGCDIPYIPVFTPDYCNSGCQMKKHIPIPIIVQLNPDMKWLSFIDINVGGNLTTFQKRHWIRSWRNVKDYKTVRYCCILSAPRLHSDVWRHIFSMI